MRGAGDWPQARIMGGLSLEGVRRARGLRPRPDRRLNVGLWRQFRSRLLGEFKFVRQEPIGPYFADFVCRQQKLVVEVDGVTFTPPTIERRRDVKREEHFYTGSGLSGHSILQRGSLPQH